jgi:hypothetical protein
VFGVLIAVIFTFAVAGVLYAEYGARSSSATPTYENEFDRCTMTCTMLMNHYNKNYAAMKSREGDKQCWRTCWNRQGEDASPSTSDMKSLWMKNREMSMRVNQCAQACWRTHNDKSGTVAVGGWRSTPRTVVCAP